MTNPRSYPLAWPIGWPRTPSHRISRSNFSTGGHGRRLSVDGALERLLGELRRLAGLGPNDIVVSTNVTTRMSDGLPRSDRPEPADRGVAVYFTLAKEPRVLACDRWDRVADNIAAIAAHIEAMRGQERWGVGTIAQAFAGFKALAAAGAIKPWWEVLGFTERPRDRAAVDEKYRELARLHHPDRGGNANQMAEVNAAYDDAQRAFG